VARKRVGGKGMSDIIFQVPATILRDKSTATGARQFVIETQEALDPEHLSRLISLENKIGWFTYNVSQIETDDIIDLPPLKKTEKDEKTPSNRLRAVFFRMWQQNNEGFKDSDSHYKYMMERLIEVYKSKLD